MTAKLGTSRDSCSVAASATILFVFLIPKSLFAETPKPRSEPITPITSFPNLDSRKVLLGRELFRSTLLSKNNTIACESCHNLRTNGADTQIVSLGVEGAKGNINTPTVFNAALNFRQFWDGRAKTLEDQIDGPVQNPIEMASRWPDVLEKLNTDPTLKNSFIQVFGEPATVRSVKDAIATFERSLVTPNSRFDKYLLGNDDALTSTEKKGFELFKNLGCISCHQGKNIGGNMFQVFGILGDYFKDRGKETSVDSGRFNLTHKDSDRHRFKVPSLRNVAITAPYFHDGSAKTLSEAVRIMARYQIGRELTAAECELVVQFLKTLTGEYAGRGLQ